MRVFIALTLDEESIIFLQKQYKKFLDFKYIRPVKDSNYHLTVKFLGNISSKEVSKYIKLIHQEDFKLPLKANIKNLIILPNKKNPRVLAVELEHKSELKEIFEKINKITSDKKLTHTKFKPHITIGRFKNNTGNINSDFNNQQKNTISIINLEIIKSELTSTGPIYTSLYKYQQL